MTLVVDANVALAACVRRDGFDRFAEGSVGPPLMWSEARSALRLGLWRGELAGATAEQLLDRLESCPVEKADPPELGREAWGVAEQLGWARTYDAEYVALARLLDARLVTLDGRLRRGAMRLASVIGPEEI